MQQSVFDTRWAMVANGYTSIIPVTGKNLHLMSGKMSRTSRARCSKHGTAIMPDATNTGIVTKFVPTLDIDILNEAAALAAEALIREQFMAGVQSWFGSDVLRGGRYLFGPPSRSRSGRSISR